MNQAPLQTDLTSTLADLRGDMSALRLLAEKFSRRYPSYIEALNAAFDTRDFLSLAENIHKLRAGLGIFHALRAQELAIHLEYKARQQQVITQDEFDAFMKLLDGVAKDISAFLGSADQSSM